MADMDRESFADRFVAPRFPLKTDPQHAVLRFREASDVAIKAAQDVQCEAISKKIEEIRQGDTPAYAARDYQRLQICREATYDHMMEFCRPEWIRMEAAVFAKNGEAERDRTTRLAACGMRLFHNRTYHEKWADERGARRELDAVLRHLGTPVKI
eukprot:gb/GEZN01017690.1/.p1 GENE.gb/GEZN01017690.1/~~gb/GEZN01017690.1/.p1  ORF type:complete len:155 (-),score=10.46 gb/GEZN01017690.1/:182-646(-)